MGWSFKLHGGLAAGLGATLLVLAGLTWLPGTLPLAESGWPVAAIAVSLFPVFGAALARLMLARADRRTMWLAFRCLPGKVQVALGALFLSGVVLTIPSGVGEGHLQAAETKDGRYFAFDTTPYERGTIEVSRSQYVVVLESDQRSMFTIPATLFVGAAYGALTAGELRRADLGTST
ncbi:hypothetical protein HHL19_32130 [Streptomyces sp. R302]|uniref:hypothetical protein n=1 Tax=unclassified Streptomyces TaxID=2593676 RepID=UPI00145C472D|nr:MULTISPECIES: hypothetical protein [unclassified Streptomyces]NML53919.1 hypothetical protein [Streptomyces sp. R301]NML83178.1 hypothetical protein [Streptomyces sp. R302]